MGANDLAKALGRMQALKAKIELGRGLEALVAEDTPGELVVPRCPDDQRRRGMPVLMGGDPDADPVLNHVRDLIAKSLEPLCRPSSPGKSQSEFEPRRSAGR